MCINLRIDQSIEQVDVFPRDSFHFLRCDPLYPPSAPESTIASISTTNGTFRRPIQRRRSSTTGSTSNPTTSQYSPPKSFFPSCFTEGRSPPCTSSVSSPNITHSPWAITSFSRSSLSASEWCSRLYVRHPDRATIADIIRSSSNNDPDYPKSCTFLCLPAAEITPEHASATEAPHPIAVSRYCFGYSNQRSQPISPITALHPPTYVQPMVEMS